MAFTDHRQDSHRVAKIIAVGTFQAALVYGIASGFDVEIAPTVRWVLPTDNYKAEPPPPPPPEQPERKPSPAPEVTAFTPPVPLPAPDSGALDRLLIDPVIPLPSDEPQLLPIPAPEPKLSVAPKQAKPRGNPGSWVTTNDYPPRDIREGNEGSVRFLLSIDAGGKVQDCEIVRSSGHPGLDEATCAKLMRRARFEPAGDAAGKRIAGSYSGTVRWVIPRD